jgi:hypothetical protein
MSISGVLLPAITPPDSERMATVERIADYRRELQGFCTIAGDLCSIAGDDFCSITR